MEDVTLTISTGASAQAKSWRNERVKWSDLAARFRRPVVTNERYNEFMTMSRADQAAIKDVGGFVGGELKGGKRDKGSVVSRQIVALDIDFSCPEMWDMFTIQYSCAALIHSTHKSCPQKPRHRLIIPLDRPVSGEEYQAIARKIAFTLNIDLFDQSTFDVNRLMFWPSVSSDMQYYVMEQKGDVLSADSILSQYEDWRDVSQWPSANGACIPQDGKRQEDPTAKDGVIGAFCRSYTIEEAIETFLADIYEPASNGRYTYRQGSTFGGVVTYNGLYAYSNHATDPACGKLCNAFDIVRIHKFGDIDKGPNDKASLRAMETFAVKDPKVRRLYGEERLSGAVSDFEGVSVESDGQADTSWTENLEMNSKGEYLPTASNINMIVEHDPILKGSLRYNLFDNKRYLAKTMPWRSVEGCEPVKDVDYAGIRNYIECVYGIASSAKIDDSLSIQFEKNTYHPIRNYIKSLKWDGKKRVDTLMIDYFGADDNPYTRAAIRKMLCAAVARVFEPGVKFDLVLVLVGAQETYKSTFIKKLGMDWFSDTFSTVQGKEAFEQLQGAWIIEMAELSGLKKAEIETVKHFITKREDSFRPAYGRTVETYKRQCVFFGTTNNVDFLRDPSGNRRFMPIDVRKDRSTKSVMDDLTREEIDMIWAETYTMYKAGERLYLDAEADEIAKVARTDHSEADDRRGLILEYLDRLLPENWDDMTVTERNSYLTDPLSPAGTQHRMYVCVAEIWCECLGNSRKDMTSFNTRPLNDILRTLDGWVPHETTRRFPIYGSQRYYSRRLVTSAVGSRIPLDEDGKKAECEPKAKPNDSWDELPY